MTSTGPAGPWKHEFVSVDGVRLHYVRQGAGSPVLLLHGWPGFWYEWAPVIPPLAAHHDVIVPDLRGFPYPPKPNVPPEPAHVRHVVPRELPGPVQAPDLPRNTPAPTRLAPAPPHPLA